MELHILLRSMYTKQIKQEIADDVQKRKQGDEIENDPNNQDCSL